LGTIVTRVPWAAIAIASSIALFVGLYGVASAVAPSSSIESVSSPPARFPQLAIHAAPARPGTVTVKSIHSQILNRHLPYQVYLPAAAEDGASKFPVLYLLHGLSADCSQWTGLGVVAEADRLIGLGEIPPMAIVMPTGDDGYWMNHRPDGPRWRDYLITELIPTVEKTEPIEARREFRAIGGISAGGHGALQLAWNNPMLFSVAGAHSPGLRSERDAFAFFGRGADFERRDPMTLAKNVARLDLDIWLDTGDADPWRNQAQQLHQTLLDRGIAHVWTPKPGGHDGSYWARRVHEYLTFYGSAFGRNQVEAASRAATLVDAAESGEVR
jgi:enterochelin esterase-like enzyme